MKWIVAAGSSAFAARSAMGTGLPRPREAAAEDEGGRGLELLELLADTWQYAQRGSGKVVAFTMNRPVS
jgi:anti-sigma regulatory factor (Ser/Thr protein kinase)